MHCTVCLGCCHSGPCTSSVCEQGCRVHFVTCERVNAVWCVPLGAQHRTAHTVAQHWVVLGRSLAWLVLEGCPLHAMKPAPRNGVVSQLTFVPLVRCGLLLLQQRSACLLVAHMPLTPNGMVVSAAADVAAAVHGASWLMDGLWLDSRQQTRSLVVMLTQHHHQHASLMAVAEFLGCVVHGSDLLSKLQQA